MKKFFTFMIILKVSFLYLYAEVVDIKKMPLYKDEIIVKYKDNLENDTLDKLGEKYKKKFATKEEAVYFIEKKYGLLIKKNYLKNIPFVCYKIPNINLMESLIKEISGEEIVEYAEPNYLRYALYTPLSKPDDPYYQSGNLWGFNRIKADYALNNMVFDVSKNKKIIVAVIDTGIGCGNNCFHEDLQGRTVNGINMLNLAEAPYDDGIDLGHGTFVAGIIAANINNTAGVAGVTLCNLTYTANVLVMPVKVLNSEGEGNDDIVYSGIVWAADNGAHVLNLSFGGKEDSITLRNAINYAYSKGCVIVAAAGNSDTYTFYPAAYSNVISVGASGILDKKVNFSNTGKIDVCAPGENIYSTDNKLSCYKYSLSSGTSFAAPFVSGLAALLLLLNENLTQQQVRNLIEQTCDDIEEPGFDNKTGWGRINVYRALQRDLSKVSGIKTYNWPNPFSPEKDLNTNIEIILNEIIDIIIEIYDAGGDLVWKREIKKNELNYGHNTILWNGKNMSGKRVNNGIYFYVIKSSKVIGKNKIAVLY